MTLSLPAELEDFLALKVLDGAFPSEEAAVSAAVLKMKNSDEDYARTCARFSEAIEIGWEQARQGQTSPLEEVLARLEIRKREWEARQSLP